VTTAMRQHWLGVQVSVGKGRARARKTQGYMWQSLGVAGVDGQGLFNMLLYLVILKYLLPVTYND
jgi:hypothetical protein